MFTIEFTATGSRKVVTDMSVRSNAVRDSYAPSMGVVGYMGNPKVDAHSRAYSVWSNMIKRCYLESATEYPRYGAKGVTVCERWHCFEYFVDDLDSIEGYDAELFEQGKIYLDKDTKQRDVDKKVYSLDTCCFVTARENSNEASKGIRYEFKATSHDGTEYIRDNITEFSEEFGLCRSRVTAYLNGQVKQELYKGWKFEKI